MEKLQFSLYALQQEVKSCLGDAFSMPIWVKAEISEMSVNRNGHCYLDLVELEQETNTVIARCRATVWSYTFRMLKPYFETVTGQAFAQGINVLLQGTVEYHEVFGLSLNIRDIDPAYTLGDMAMQRKKIIKKLQDNGVFGMNKELELPSVAQRVAIISSPTAAGLQDFHDQLHNNRHGFVFYTHLFSSAMQGVDAPRDIIDALGRIFEHEEMFDVVAIIRGGGAQLDLACFDNYDLAFNIAQFPLPVITGIGHEKDDTVTDMVAHTRLKTPTAVAEFLISGALQFSQQLANLETQFADLANEQLDYNKKLLNDAAIRLNQSVGQIIVGQRNRLNIAVVELENSAREFVKDRNSELRGLAGNTKNMAERYVMRHNHWIGQTGSKLNYLFREQVLKNKNRLSRYSQTVKIQGFAMLNSENKNLKMMEEKLRLSDPRNVLKRGYSITLLNGKALKSAQMLAEGDRLVTILDDGTFESTVTKNNRL